MSGQGRSTASSRSRHLSPRLTVSAGSQSQRSAYTIYSDVESDHNVFAFVPPPVAAEAQAVEDLDHPPAPALPPAEVDPLPATTFRFPTSDSNRRRALFPSFGQFARHLDIGSESSGPGTANSRSAAQEDGSVEDWPELPSIPSGSGGGHTARTSDSDVFNFVMPAEDTPPTTRPVIVSDDVRSASSSGDRSGSEKLSEKETNIRYT